MNQAQIIGNLTADPECKETPNGHKVATFSIATNRKYKDGN
jgi:single-strand DNA-binding protein